VCILILGGKKNNTIRRCVRDGAGRRRSDLSQPTQIFQLKTDTYGTLSASFLATLCLGQIAKNEYNNHPNACFVIRRNFYMDNYLGSANIKKNTVKLRDELRHFLQNADYIYSNRQTTI